MGEAAQGKLVFKDGAGWRSWLKKNHAIADEAWLIHYKKNSGKTAISHEEAL